MKRRQAQRTMGALALAFGSTVYSQNSATVTNAINEGNPPPVAEKTKSDLPQASKPMFSFEGTDLRIGNMPPITFHGFASQGLLTSSDYNYMGKTSHGLGSPEFNEFGLNASISPFARTRISAQAFAFDLGNVGNYTPMLDYGLIDYNFCNEFGIRGGRIRRPSGIYNQFVDVDLARTYVLLPQGVYDARWRDFYASLDGGSLYGNVNLGKAGSLSYEGFGGMINLVSDGGIARIVENQLRGKGLPFSVDQMGSSPLAGVQLWWNTPVEGLRAGYNIFESLGMNSDASLYHPKAGTIPLHLDADTLAMQTSLEYVWKSWTFQAECFYRETEQKNTQTMLGASTVTINKNNPLAWYVGAAYRVNKWMEVGTYYTEAYENNSLLKVASDKYQKDIALTLRFDPKPWWAIKLEGHHINGTGLLRDDSLNPVRNGDGWFMLALKTTFSF